METLYDDFKSNKDFVMLAVSQDTKGRAAVAPYVAKNGYHFTVLLDPENKVGESLRRERRARDFHNRSQGPDRRPSHGRFDWSRPDVKDALQQLLDSKKG